MTDSQEIVCKPTKWFLLRALAMTVMFAVGAFMFFKDWKFGYPKDNVERFYHLAFDEAEERFRDHLEDGKSAAEWESFAQDQLVFKAIENSEEKVTEPAKVLPTGTDLTTTWPSILTDYATYSQFYEDEAELVSAPGWKTYTNSDGRKWKEKSDKKLKSFPKIQEQLYIGILCLALLLAALFVLLRTLRRSLKVDAEGYHTPNGKFIPFGQIRKIDARKWDTKGLAYLYYEDNGQEKKTKLDGMVYGQFKKEEGEPAQKLYEQILANFQGELIELVPEDDDDSEEEKSANKAANDSAD